MFGTFRYALAVLVLLQHTAPHFAGRDQAAGAYAVFSFFVLSGYLITRIMNERYGYSAEGIGRFLVNRALRVYPVYWFTFALSLLTVVAFPQVSKFYLGEHLLVPDQIGEWLKNVFIFGTSNMMRAKLLPHAWSLDVELVYWTAIALFLGRFRAIIPAWFGVSIAYTVYLLVVGVPFYQRYFNLAGASVCFSLGAVLFLLGRQKTWHHGITVAAAIVFLAHALLSCFLWTDARLYGLYLSMVIGAVLQFGLAQLDERQVPSWFRKLDSFLGDLSYPFYMCHWPVLVLVAVYFGGMRFGFNQFLLTLPIVHVVAYFMVTGIEHPMQAIRARIRSVEPVQPVPARILVEVASGEPMARPQSLAA